MQRRAGTWRRRALVIVALLGLLVVLAAPALAVEYRSGSSVTINPNEVIDDDLFLSGSTVTMNGTINGNLFVAGMQVEVNGTVLGSVFAAGQTVTVNGRVGGSVYTAGSSVTLGPQAQIARNALFAGYGLRNEAGSSVGRDLVATGAQVVIIGDVTRNVQSSSNALEINGRVGGNVVANVSGPGQTPTNVGVPGAPPAIAPGIRVGPNAVIRGSLTYSSPVDQNTAIRSQPGGGINYRPTDQRQGRPVDTALLRTLRWILARIRDFITLLLLGLLAIWLVPDQLTRLAGLVRSRPLPALGWGIVVLLVGYIGTFVLAGVILALSIALAIVTLGGLSWVVLGLGFSALGLAFTAFQLMVAYGSKLVVAFLVGLLFLERPRGRRLEHHVWSLVLGVLVYVLLSAIPFVGVLIAFLVTLAGLGALWMAYGRNET